MGSMEAVPTEGSLLHGFSRSRWMGAVFTLALLVSGTAGAQWGGNGASSYPPPAVQGSSGETPWDWNSGRFRPREGEAARGEGRTVNPWQHPVAPAGRTGGSPVEMRPWGELPPEARGREGDGRFPPLRQPREWPGEAAERWQGGYPPPYYPPFDQGTAPRRPFPPASPYPPAWGGEGGYMPW